ncbi:hypothetical protein BDR03DRAFT_851411, partial [Suillus americanus]
LTQLRTGHIPLNKHLHKIARAPSPICPACEEKEKPVHHFLLSCPAYARHRAIMKAELGTCAQRLSGLLNDGKSIKAVLKYIACTQRLASTFGDVSPPAQKKRS